MAPNWEWPHTDAIRAPDPVFEALPFPWCCFAKAFVPISTQKSIADGVEAKNAEEKYLNII